MRLRLLHSRSLPATPPRFQSDSQQLEEFHFEEAEGMQLTVSAWNANYSLKMAGVNVTFFLALFDIESV